MFLSSDWQCIKCKLYWQQRSIDYLINSNIHKQAIITRSNEYLMTCTKRTLIVVNVYLPGIKVKVLNWDPKGVLCQKD